MANAEDRSSLKPNRPPPEVLMRLDRIRPVPAPVPPAREEDEPGPLTVESAPPPATRPGDRPPAPTGLPELPKRWQPGAVTRDGSTRRRRSRALISFLVVVLLPTLVAGIYFAFIASPQYMSEFRFSVRPVSTGNLAAMAASGDATMIMSDSYIVADYVTSRDVLDELQRQLNLRDLYTKPGIDYLSRFDPEGSVEEFVSYWQGRISSYFDLVTGITTVEVTAFSPEDAHRITSIVKQLCEALVNDISEQARREQVNFAQAELGRAEQRLTDAQRKAFDFRNQINTIDAAKSAEADFGIVTQLRTTLSQLRTEYASSRAASLTDDAPTQRALRNRIAATEEQLKLMESRVSSRPEDGNAIGSGAEVIGNYESIQLEQTIAQQLYESALRNFENARMTAANNLIYLATYVQPSLPQRAAYPRVFIDTMLVFLCGFGAWVVLGLIFTSLKDHA